MSWLAWEAIVHVWRARCIARSPMAWTPRSPSRKPWPDAGGRTDADSLASALSYSGVRNGAFLSRLANARLFGLVAGRSGQVVLTDRGRRCLSTDGACTRRALAEACWAVPLFRRVLEDASGGELGDLDGLATVLETRFGEDSSRSQDHRPGPARVGRAGRTPASRTGGPLPGQRSRNEFSRIPIQTLDARSYPRYDGPGTRM